MNATVTIVPPEADNMTTGSRTAVETTPMSMLDRAVAQGASIETLEKLMGLQERWERNAARRAFDAAIAAAKSEITVVSKNATGHNAKRYANFAAYARAIDPVIGKHGLSYRFRTHQDDRIHVTCVISHRDGHSEENTLSGPADTTGSKNPIQAIGSTLTYLQRYALVQGFGLAASEDDDGNGAGSGATLSDQQLAELDAYVATHDLEPSKILTMPQCGGAHAFADIPAANFAQIMVLLRVYVDKRDAKK